MIDNAVLINGISPKDLENMISRIIDEKLDNVSRNPEPEVKGKDGYFTAKETAKILRVSVDTLNKWTKIGVITPRRIGTSIRYTQGDIDNALKGGKKCSR